MLARLWQTLLARLWHEDEGLLTFEYILLNTALVLGTVGAVSGIRDSINSEAAGLTQSIRSLDQMRPACLPTASSGQTGSGSAAQPNSSANPMPIMGLADDIPVANAAVATTPSAAAASVTTPAASPASGVQL